VALLAHKPQLANSPDVLTLQALYQCQHRSISTSRQRALLCCFNTTIFQSVHMQALRYVAMPLS
jgi:hypothetical protein